MNNRIELLEDELAALLQGQFFEAKSFPDCESAFVPSFTPKVYVMYDNSDYSENENLSIVVQEEKIKIGFEIHARTRRGNEGIFAIQKIIYQKILGYKPEGCDKLSLLQFIPLEGNKPNDWAYYALFTTITHVAEALSDPDDEGNILKTYDFVEP